MTKPPAIVWTSLEVRLVLDDEIEASDEVLSELLESVAYELAQYPEVGGVEVRDASTGYRSPLSVLPGTEETEAEAAADREELGRWLGASPGLIVFTTPEGKDGSVAALEAVLDGYPCTAQINIERHEGDRWRDAWKEFYRPLAVANAAITIRPSWLVDEQTSPNDVILDPGRAFGTGLHETTRLCLDAVATGIADGWKLTRILDLGCGSGILGIVAARLLEPAKTFCTFVDHEQDAVEATQENLAYNHFDALQTEVILGDAERSTQGPFDLVFANIRPNVLIPHANEIAAQVGSDGRLILSGILDEEAADVRAAYDTLLIFQGAPSMNGWTALTYHRPTT